MLPVPSAAAVSEARDQAIKERVLAARRERHGVGWSASPGVVEVAGRGGFAYRVTVRGAPDGPHGCTCPDFEGNRLHTCKHVESARLFLRARASRLPRAHRSAAFRTRVYLHLGERVEPRLWRAPGEDGRPGQPARFSFDADGRPGPGVPQDERALLGWLETLGASVEPAALDYLRARSARRPVLPQRDPVLLLPRLPIKPYDFQWEGIRFLARTGRALLADEMGLGKTVQAILAAGILERTGQVRRTVVVCPASLKEGWAEEIRRLTGRESLVVQGPPVARRRAILEGRPWTILHYEQLLRDHAWLAESPPDLLIVDEAQRVKGLASRTARVLKSVPTRFLFALTGTPLENRLEEAYALAQIVDQRLLPPLWQIDARHFVREKRRVVAYRDLDLIRAHLAGAFLRRRKEDVTLQLPERIRETLFVPMHPLAGPTHDEKIALAARIARKKFLRPEDIERIQRLLLVARRACDGPHLLGETLPDPKVPKLAELAGLLRELCLDQGRKVVVFSEWTDMTRAAERVAARLRLPVFHLHGDVPVPARGALIRAFRDRQGPAVFVSTDAGGVGLNLQAADAVIALDLPWNPARLEQRLARVHRIGQARTVQVVLLATENSIEHRMLPLHETKRAVLDAVWAKDGARHLAAPGGSGAFLDLVRTLLGEDAAAPAPGAPGPVAAPAPGAPPAVVPASGVAAAAVGAPAAEAQAAGALAAAAAGSAPAPSPPAAGARAAAAPPAGATLEPAALISLASGLAAAVAPEARPGLAQLFGALAAALVAEPASAAAAGEAAWLHREEARLSH